MKSIITSSRMASPFRCKLLLAIVSIALSAAPTAMRAQSFYISGGVQVAGANGVISKVDSTGTVSLFATLAASTSPLGVAVDGTGYVYVAQTGTHDIARVSPGGVASIFATLPPTAYLTGLAFDPTGNLYVGSGSDLQIYKIAPDGTVSVFAAMPPNSLPMGLAFDSSGNLYVADYRQIAGPAYVYKLTPDGTMSTFATLPDGSFPMGLAFDSSGNLYAADTQTFQVSKITPAGAVSAFANLPLNTYPTGLTFDSAGNLCVTRADGELDKIAPDGSIVTFASGIPRPQFVVNAPVLALDRIAVEGGFSATGAVYLNISPAAAAATVLLSSDNPSLVSVPASVTLPQGTSAAGFPVNTAAVSATTVAHISATYDGRTVSASVTLTPAPTVSLVALTAREVNGGTAMPVTVTLNNFPRAAAGAVVSLVSSDPATVQLPATVTVAQGATNATVMAPTAVVSGRKGVTLRATYNGATLTTTAFVNPIPTVTIIQADYFTDTHEFKVAATTSVTTNAVITYGTNPNAAPLGTMQFETNAFRASSFLNTPPTEATVWNSLGGSATVAVRLKTSPALATNATFKLSISLNGKGSVTASPAASSYATGTVVTLTATPAAGSPWVGWSGAITGTANPTSVTITKDTAVTANFR